MLGQAHHFRALRPRENLAYATERYTREASRLYGVLDRRLGEADYVADDYSIADMAIMPWLRSHERQGQDLDDFPNVKRWFEARSTPARRCSAASTSSPTAGRDPAKMDDQARSIMFGDEQYKRR